MTAGIGMVWVRLRHLSLLDTSMCAHSDNRHGEEEAGGRRCCTKTEFSYVLHCFTFLAKDDHYSFQTFINPIHFVGFLTFTLKLFLLH